MMLHCGTELDMIADQYGFSTAFGQWDPGLGFCLLRSFVDDYGVEDFGFELAESGADASCEDEATFFDSLLCFTAAGWVFVEVFAHHGVTGVLAEVFSYFADLGGRSMIYLHIACNGDIE